MKCNLPETSMLLTENHRSETGEKPRAASAAASVQKGFTVLEVVVAMVIFACVYAAMLGAVVNGDRIKGRGSALRHATILAGNELERIKSRTAEEQAWTDTSYSLESAGRTFSVERKRVSEDPASFSFSSALDDTVSLREIEVSVRWGSDEKSVVHFRTLYRQLLP